MPRPPATTSARRLAVTDRRSLVPHHGRAVGAGRVDLPQIVGPESRRGVPPGHRSTSHRPGRGSARGCGHSATPCHCGHPEEEFLARRGQRQSGATRTAPRNQRRARDLDNEGIIPVLARAVREVEAGAQRGSLRPSGRTKFQVVALLVREERARVKADETISDAQRTEQLKRLDGSRRSSRRLPPGTPHCWLCSPKTLSSPRRPCRSSATWCWRPVWSRPPKRSPAPSP